MKTEERLTAIKAAVFLYRFSMQRERSAAIKKPLPLVQPLGIPGLYTFFKRAGERSERKQKRVSTGSVEKEGGLFYLISFADENFLLSSLRRVPSFLLPRPKRDKSGPRLGRLALAESGRGWGCKRGGQNELATFN